MIDTCLSLKSIAKSFAANQVLKSVSFSVKSGDVLALMGENGAGKSTLMNIISGLYSDFEGELSLDNRRVTFDGPKDAEAAGISMVHQELSLVPELSIAENIYLGHEPLTRLGLIDYTKMNEHARKQLQPLGLNLDVTRAVSRLRIGEQQVVEIARALSRQARVLILDEPTAALSETESEQLFKLVDSLAKDGVIVLYISHRLDELFRLANRVAVLRNGELVADGKLADYNREQLIRLMVGQDVEHFYNSKSSSTQQPMLQLHHVSLENRSAGSLHDINLCIHRGEILGLTGLMGSGIGTLLELLFGVYGKPNGLVELGGEPVVLSHPAQAIAEGFALVSDDRKRDGLVLQQTVDFNLQLPSLAQQRHGLVDNQLQHQQALISRLAIKCTGGEQLVGALSGGNQQKVVLGRWLPLQPKVLLLNEPTRGVDVGAKAEIYKLLSELATSGMAILLAGTDLPELMALSDRIVVMREGSISAVLEKPEFSQHSLLSYAQVGGPQHLQSSMESNSARVLH